MPQILIKAGMRLISCIYHVFFSGEDGQAYRIVVVDPEAPPEVQNIDQSESKQTTTSYRNIVINFNIDDKIADAIDQRVDIDGIINVIAMSTDNDRSYIASSLLLRLFNELSAARRDKNPLYNDILNYAQHIIPTLLEHGANIVDVLDASLSPDDVPEGFENISSYREYIARETTDIVASINNDVLTGQFASIVEESRIEPNNQTNIEIPPQGNLTSVPDHNTPRTLEEIFSSIVNLLNIYNPTGEIRVALSEFISGIEERTNVIVGNLNIIVARLHTRSSEENLSTTEDNPQNIVSQYLGSPNNSVIVPEDNNNTQIPPSPRRSELFFRSVDFIGIDSRVENDMKLDDVFSI